MEDFGMRFTFGLFGKCIGSHYNYVTHRCSRSAQTKKLGRQKIKCPLDKVVKMWYNVNVRRGGGMAYAAVLKTVGL